MTDAERADLAIRAARALLRSNENLHDLLAEVHGSHEAAVEGMRANYAARELLLELEEEAA